MSRTMQLAMDDSSNVLQRRGTWFSTPLVAVPHTKVERYWAARALVAETVLSAHERHQVELGQVRRMEEQKREREIQTLIHANDQRQKRSERWMVVYLVVLLGSVGWLVKTIAPDRSSHFTIPILSPFASVVENETGIFGTKAVAIFIVVIGIATYTALKHRISQWHLDDVVHGRRR